MEHKGTVRLETQRLILRRFTEEDADAAFRNWTGDPEVTRYLTWPAHRSAEDTLDYMRFCISGYEAPDFYQWGMESRETGEVIGNISVVDVKEEIGCAALGYCLGRDFWGRGYMPEAVEKVISFLFEEVGARRIEASHDVENPRSGRVMQKAGMTAEGVLRQAGRNNRGVVDVALYSILPSDRTGEKG